MMKGLKRLIVSSLAIVMLLSVIGGVNANASRKAKYSPVARAALAVKGNDPLYKGFYLANPKASYDPISSQLPHSHKYINYLSGNEDLYRTVPNRKHAKIVANRKTVVRLAKRYVPFRYVKAVHAKGYDMYYKIADRRGLTGWIKTDGVYSFGSKRLVNRSLRAYYRYVK